MKHAAVLKAVFLVLSSSAVVNGAKLLFVLYQQPSHVLMKLGIGTDLVARGHRVYIALADGHPTSRDARRAGFEVIHYDRSPDVVYPFTAEFEEKLAESIYDRRTSDGQFVAGIARADCVALMNDATFLTRLKKFDFDFAIVEPFLPNPCFMLVPHRLGIPYASAIAGTYPFAFRLPMLPSFYTTVPVGPFRATMPELNTLVGRLSNVAALIGLRTFYVAETWGDASLLQKFAPGVESWEQLVRRSELVLFENDHHLDNALPLLPHVVTIAGCTVRTAQALPDQLEEIMRQSGEHGVVLASFGTSAYRMPPEVAMRFMEAFGQLKETVVTRMAVPAGNKIPSNVHMLPWLPQNDILGHPKTRLFLTHSGSNGQYEALYHGVPMLGIPMFAEQGWNCARAKQKGISLCLDLLEFTSVQLYAHIRELIDNVTYRLTVQRRSAILRDEPLFGSHKAGHWIDHVIKFGGAHLRSPAVDQPLYQFLMFDVIGFLLLIVSALGLVIVIGVIYLTKILKTWLKLANHEIKWRNKRQ